MSTPSHVYKMQYSIKTGVTLLLPLYQLWH